MATYVIDRLAQDDTSETVWWLTLRDLNLPYFKMPSPLRPPDDGEPQPGHAYFLHADLDTRTAWNNASQNNPMPTAILVHVSAGGPTELPPLPGNLPEGVNIRRITVFPNHFAQAIADEPNGGFARLLSWIRTTCIAH